MRNKQLLITVITLLIIMLSLVLSACTQPTPTPAPTPTPTPSPKPVEPVKLKFAYTMPLKTTLSVGWHWWAEEIEKQTQGRIKFEFYPSGTLFPMEAAVDSIKGGVADLGMIAASTHAKSFPLIGITGLPLLGFPDTLEGNIAGSNAVFAVINKFPELQKQTSEFKWLFAFVTPNRGLVTKTKEVHLPGDLKGLKIGGSGSVIDFAAMQGAAKVVVVPPDSYTSLEKGVVDGMFLTKGQAHDYKIFEISKYFVDYTFGQGCMLVAMNMNSWNKISAGDQR